MEGAYTLVRQLVIRGGRRERDGKGVVAGGGSPYTQDRWVPSGDNPPREPASGIAMNSLKNGGRKEWLFVWVKELSLDSWRHAI